MKINKGVKAKPRNVLIYGEHGTGKTTLASTFPAPLIIDVEGGSDDLDVSRTERIRHLEEFYTVGHEIVNTKPEFKTLVIDSIDWLEKLLWKQITVRAGKESIEDFGFGKGYVLAAEEFEKMIQIFRSWNSAGYAVVIIGHAKAVRHNPPDGESFDRWEPDLHTRVQGPLCEFCDEVLFLKKKTFTKKEDLGFKKERSIVLGTEERVLVCCDTGSVVAKNRLQMPHEIPATFQAYASYVMAARAKATQETPTGNIAGLVVDGSSKPKAETIDPTLAELRATNVF